MKNICILFALLLIFTSSIFGQGQFNNWYCGYGAGMTFNSGAPTIITPNPMYTDDNSATISDANGNLLFFANGTTAYDRNGNIMPNGNGLYGNSTAGQTATIVQMPGSNTKYYLFTMDAMAGPNGATYSVVDMTLNGGLGDIVSGQKNITILAPATEKIEPVRHANGIDVWIIIHEWNTDAYRAYLLTSAGLSTAPVVTNIGTVATGGFSPGYNAMGQLVVNDANNMLAAAVFSDGNIQLFDFDNSTGILSNTILINQTKAFGLQFSPNGNLLYASSWTESTLYQYDVSTYTAAAISASQVNLGTCDGEGYLETGPDGKIYVAKWQTNYIGVINNPNGIGTACNFVDQGFYTGSYQSSAGLVDKILINSICTLAVNLGNDTTICSASFTLIDTNSNTHHVWSNGDTTASIAVTATGSYWVTDTRGNCTASDTINVTFANVLTPFNLGSDTTYCGSFSRVLSTGNANTVWNTGVTASQITVTTPGTYRAEIITPCDTVRDSIVISQNPLPAVNLGNDTNICNSNPLTLNATTANATYSWENGTTASTLTISASGIYWVDVTVNGCMKRDSIVVSYINPTSFSIGNDTTYCGSFSRVLTAGVAHTIWSTGDTATSITVDTPGTYRAVAYACGDTLTDSITIKEKPLPVVDLGNDTSVCPDHDVILNAGNPGATYQWQNNTTGQTLTVDSAGIYWVDVTVNGCTKQDSIQVVYLSPPLPFVIGNDTTICEDSSLILNAYQLNTNYFWSTGDTTPSITVDQSGQYQVIDSNVCGSYSATVNVTTKQCVCKIAIPTAFSPNNDGKNDYFYVLTQCPLQNFQFDIYNRWGQKIFTTDTITGKWDGTYRGLQQPLGVYVYFLKYTDPYTNEEHSQTGNVTLMR